MGICCSTLANPYRHQPKQTKANEFFSFAFAVFMDLYLVYFIVSGLSCRSVDDSVSAIIFCCIKQFIRSFHQLIGFFAILPAASKTHRYRKSFAITVEYMVSNCVFDGYQQLIHFLLPTCIKNDGELFSTIPKYAPQLCGNLH